jgi:hypothetical protein
MPYIYAVEEVVYEDGVPPKPSEIKGFSREYHTASKELAETSENGRWKLVSIHGKPATDWVRFNPRKEAELIYGKGSPLHDVTGTSLAVGDFVMTTIAKYADLYLCEVVSFTAQKVRVRNLRDGYATVLKETTDIVKVDKSLYV